VKNVRVDTMPKTTLNFKDGVNIKNRGYQPKWHILERRMRYHTSNIAHLFKKIQPFEMCQKYLAHPVL
jgi:hypothetical protein